MSEEYQLETRLEELSRLRDEQHASICETLRQERSVSEGRLSTLLEKSQALRDSEIRADNLEGERDRLSVEVAELRRERDLLAHVLTALRLWMGEYPTDKYTGEWWQRELDRLTSAGKADADRLVEERDQLRAEVQRLTIERENFARAAEGITRIVAEKQEAEAEVVRLRGITPELPDRPPEGHGIPRYGIRWNGPTEPMSVPMEDGYWTPWHLAHRQIEYLVWDRNRLERLLAGFTANRGTR